MIQEYDDIKARRLEMSKETWIKNVLRIFPEKTREEVEILHSKLFDSGNMEGKIV